MNCPHCGKPIDPRLLAKHLGKAGGAKSKRKITPAQQAKMQRARRIRTPK